MTRTDTKRMHDSQALQAPCEPLLSGVSITVWNVEWAMPRTPRGTFFQQRLVEPTTSVACVTEGFAALLPNHGDLMLADPDYGYPLRPHRRKVMLWSRLPWRDVDLVGDPALPPGRFVAGTTETPIGDVRFIGVCIPWRDAHVRTGRRDRKPWADHLSYLRHLRSVLDRYADERPSVILGDFNQRVPRVRQPTEVYAALMATMQAMTFATAGRIGGAPTPSIDHVACTPDLMENAVRYLSPHDDGGGVMSDHFGVEVRLQRAGVGAIASGQGGTA